MTGPAPDDSRIKVIETSLGTGDGLIRALAHFGHQDLMDRSIVIFGCGKVGSGAAAQVMGAGAKVIVIDRDVANHSPTGADFIEASDQDGVRAAVASAWCVVTATGLAGALTPLVDDLRNSGAILANLGAQDEFGLGMPASRVRICAIWTRRWHWSTHALEQRILEVATMSDRIAGG